LSGRPAGALAGIAMTLLLAAPVGAASPGAAPPRSGHETHGQAAPGHAHPPVRDVILGEPEGVSARISATTTKSRYSIGDGGGTTIAISVTAACQASCTDADPQRIANFVGTLLHGPEVELLTIQLDAPFEIEFDCGYGAQACYYPSQNKIVLSGNDTPATDGASRDMVLAHEYGHHVAHHRANPTPFPQPLEWGTARWASYEHVCQQRRAGVLFPGDGGLHYYEDPGEAFAEAFARYHFPDTEVRWKWIDSLGPDAGAFEAIREDTLEPWVGRTSIPLAGHVPSGRAGSIVRSFSTPIDGKVTMRPLPPSPRRFELSLRNPAGHLLQAARNGVSPRGKVSFTVCGQTKLRVVLTARQRPGSPFKLLVHRP
jgi:hypothetical protein